MSLTKFTYTERARIARDLRRQIAIVEQRRLVRLELHDEMVSYCEQLLDGFFADCKLIHRLRSAANRLEFIPENEGGAA